MGRDESGSNWLTQNIQMFVAILHFFVRTAKGEKVWRKSRSAVFSLIQIKREVLRYWILNASVNAGFKQTFDYFFSHRVRLSVRYWSEHILVNQTKWLPIRLQPLLNAARLEGESGRNRIIAQIWAPWPADSSQQSRGTEQCKCTINRA